MNVNWEFFTGVALSDGIYNKARLCPIKLWKGYRWLNRTKSEGRRVESEETSIKPRWWPHINIYYTKKRDSLDWLSEPRKREMCISHFPGSVAYILSIFVCVPVAIALLFHKTWCGLSHVIHFGFLSGSHPMWGEGSLQWFLFSAGHSSHTTCPCQQMNRGGFLRWCGLDYPLRERALYGPVHTLDLKECLRVHSGVHVIIAHSQRKAGDLLISQSSCLLPLHLIIKADLGEGELEARTSEDDSRAVLSSPGASSCLLLLQPSHLISISPLPPKKSAFLSNTIIESKGNTPRRPLTLRNPGQHNGASALAWWRCASWPFLASHCPFFSFLFCSSPVLLHPALNTMLLLFGRNWTLNFFQTHGVTSKFRAVALITVACSHLQFAQSCATLREPVRSILLGEAPTPPPCPPYTLSLLPSQVLMPHLSICLVASPLLISLIVLVMWLKTQLISSLKFVLLSWDALPFS